MAEIAFDLQPADAGAPAEAEPSQFDLQPADTEQSAPQQFDLQPEATPARALAYGPVVGEYTGATLKGPLGNLGPRDIAVSPNLLAENGGTYKLGQVVDAHAADGTNMGSFRIADTSWFSPGKPTTNTIEFRDRDISNQGVTIQPASHDFDLQPDGSQPTTGSTDTSHNIPGDPLSDKGKTSALLAFGLGAARAIPGVAAGAGLAGSLEGPNIAISAFTGPAAPVTMAGLNILEFLGGMLIGNRVSKEGEKALAPHSELIRNAQAAAADHPLAEMVGEQVPMAPFVLRSAKGFYDVAKSADTASAAAKSIAKGLTGGAAGGAATEAARPHVEQALNFAGQQLGLTPEQIQEPTVRSYLENAAIGAALAGEAARQGAGDKGIGDVKVPMRTPEVAAAPIPATTAAEAVAASQDVGPVSSPGEVVASTTQAPIEPVTSPGQETRPTTAAAPPEVSDAELMPALQRAMARNSNPAPGYKVFGTEDKGFTVTTPGGTKIRIDKGKTLEHVNLFTHQDAEGRKLKLRADRNEAGFLNPELLQGAADFGRQIYRRGMDFAQWAGEMVRALGRKIRPHLAALWNSITGQNILPGAREWGGINIAGERTVQTKQTNTPQFRNWFGESKVVDEKGDPLVVYHGTADSFNYFDLDHPNRKDTGWLGTGVYVTTDPLLARSYSMLKGGREPQVMQLYARLENPYHATIRDKQRLQLISHSQGAEAGRAAADVWTRELKSKGHDGVILEYKASEVGKNSASSEMVVFDPAGVKSATRNSGAFSRLNPDIGGGVDISQGSIEDAANRPEKQREHIKTIQRMTEVSPNVKEQVESWYSPSSIPEVNARAQARIDEQSLDAVLLGLMKRELTSNDDLALAHAAALRLDGMGRIDDAITVREKMAESLTGPAQMLQYISTISKTSPEGLVREAQKTVTNFIAQDPEKQKLLADIQRLQQQVAAATAGQTPEAVKATINLTLRDLAKVNKPGQRLTPERLNDLIKRNDAGTLTADELARALMRHLNIPQVTPENISRIKAAQKLYAQAEANGDSIMRLRRGMEMMDQVYGLVPRSFWDKVRATATISMILHGKLPFRIGFSNAVRLIGQTMVDTIENVPRDLGNVFTGKRTITVDQFAGIGRGLAEPYFTFRSGYEDAKLRGLTTGRSFVEGTKTLIDIASMTTRGIMDLTDIRGRNSHTFSSKFGQMAENVVTLIHNIVPYAFWNAGYRSSLARQMRVAGVETPTAEMVGLARVDANKAIFQNETVAYHALFGVRKILDADINYLSRGRVKNFTKMQAKYGLGTATIPFAKVPAALLTEGANWTPLGLVRALGETARPLFGHELRPKEIADNVIKAAIGTGSAFFAGMWLSKLGVLSGPMDDDKNMKAMMQSLGWGAYKLNLSELKRRMASGDWTSSSTIPQPGDLIVNYNWAEPIAFPVAMGAHITEAQNAEKRAGMRGRLTSGELVTSIGAGAEALLDNPMLQSVQQLSTNLGEGNYGKLFTDIVGNVPGNFIPSLVRQTAQYMDNTVREARGGSMVDGEVARIVQQIPGLSQRFPARYDVFGEAVKRQNYGQVSLINTFFNPAQVSRFKANPEVSELMRLWIATGSSAGTPRGVDKSLTITKVNGQKQQIQLDNQQLATYQRYVGRLSAAMVTRLMASPAYAAAPDVVRQNTLTQVLEAVQRSAKIDLFGDRPFRVNMGSLTSKPSVSLPSFMDIGALAGGRQQGLTQPVPVGN